MVIVQLGVTAAVALVRLRAYAYSHERRLRDVAADVVARRLRFDPDTDTADGGEATMTAERRSGTFAPTWDDCHHRSPKPTGLAYDEGE